MKDMFNPPKDNKPQDKKNKDDRPPINPAPPLTAEDRAYWGKMESDRKKREEIAKIEGYPDNIEEAAGNIEVYEKSKKAIGEFLDSIIEDFKKSAKTQHDFCAAIERISILCNDHKIRREDIDNSWTQEQVNEIVNANDRFENSKGSKIYNFSRLTDIFETSSRENIAEKNSSDLVARALSQKIENSEKLSIPTQRAIENFSKIVTYAGIESKMEFLLSVFYNQDKLLGGTKMEIISNMAIFNPSEEFFRQIENYVTESKDDAYKLMSAIDVLDCCAMISSQGIRHKRIKDITFNITNAIASNKKINYFVATKAFQLSHKLENPHDPRLKYPADYKTLKTGEDLEFDYNIKPVVEAEDQYKLKTIKEHCYYRKASEKYGVIYEPDGKVNSFFILNPEAAQKARAEHKRIEPQRISLDEILNNEGFRRQNTEEGEREYKNLTRNYLALLELPLKVTIENYFKVKIDSLSVREQLQFLKLLSTKNSMEMIGIGDFLNKSQDDKGKINRMKSFLSLEFNHEGEESVNIMKIDSDPTIKEETKEKLFANYAQLIDESEKSVEEIMKIIEEIFFTKKFDKNQVQTAILRKASELFEKAQVEFLGANITATFERDGWVGNEKLGGDDAERLVNYVLEMKDGILEKLTADIKKERLILQKELEELKIAASIINESLSDLTRSTFEKEILASYERARSGRPELQWLVEREMKNAKEMAKYGVSKGFPHLYDDFLEKNKKYDSDRIKKIIEYYKSRYLLTEQDIIDFVESHQDAKDFFANLKTQKEKDDFLAGVERGMIEGLEKEEEIRKYKEIYEPLVKKLEKLLVYQEHFEQKLEKIIYGQESARLPDDILKNVDDEYKKNKKENFPDQKDIYFPVGISIELSEWEKVFSGEKKVAKTVDIYGYLFWLNNLEKEVKLVVCDEVQRHNYVALYNKSNNEATSLAGQIGRQEKENYQKIIETFGFKNIKLLDYNKFLENKKEKIEKYRHFCNNLAKKEIWKEAFLAMVQDSSRKDKNNKEKQLPYAVEELALILATDGEKISHLNEAPYDIIASIIQNAENYAKENRIDIFDENNEKQFEGIVKGVLDGLQNLINERKSKSGNDSYERQYFIKAYECVNKIKINLKKVQSPENFNKKQVKFNFFCPEIGSQSFGWGREGNNLKADKISFKEPYSTYFYNNKAEIFSNTDQVVAVPDGHIGGKILTFGSKSQIEYARKVLKPMLTNFFKILDNAPQQYFDKVKKQREEIIKECKESNRLSDLLRFIQKYIIEPSSL